MLPLSVLTLALLGGFVFVNWCNLTRYSALQSAGYRLVFNSAIAGVFFLFLATVLTPLLLVIPGAKYIGDTWNGLIPFEQSGKPTIAFLMGALLWIPLNLLGKYDPMVARRWRPLRFLSDGSAIDREIQKKQNPIEVLLRQAMGSKSLVSVTVQSGKVYIGRVLTTSNPAFGVEAVNILLSRSGHRDKNTLKMQLDVDYEQTHSDVRQELVEKVRAEFARVAARNPNPDNADELLDEVKRRVSGETEIRNYEIAIPISEVQSVNVFDMDIYNRFFASEEPEGFVRPPEP